MSTVFSDAFRALKPSAIREILKSASDPDTIALSAGNPSPDAFPGDALASISADILRQNTTAALQYGVSEGYAPLRDHLRGYLKRKYHVGSDKDEILITAGAQQVMDLAARVLCNPGDVVICEDPSFIGCLNAFRALGLTLYGVPVEKDGMDIDALEQALKECNNARMIYTIPNFQNPTGVTMSWEKRQRMYELAKAYGVIIVEDNPYGDLRYRGDNVPAIKTLDHDGIVVYAGSFSKVIAPGLRVGYAVAPADILAKMTVAKQTEDVHSGGLSQILCHRFMTEYDFEEHLETIRSLYRRKAILCEELLREQLAPLGVTFFPVDGGLFYWCMLPDGIDMTAFCAKAAADKKVTVVPGTAFLCDEAGESRAFRVNFSTPTDDSLREGIVRLTAVLREMQG